MKIKLAILEKDANYLSKMVSAFGTKFAEKLEVYSFTDINIAMDTLKHVKMDVFLSNDSFEIDTKEIPKRCAFAYFVDSSDFDSVNGEKAICKYQKAEQIYKQILSIYAEKANNIAGIKISGDTSNVISFVSACGGVGSSSMAVACALRFAAQGKRTLYLNLEQLGVAEIYFSGEGQFTLSDVIFALKSKKANLQMKLESNVLRDPRGVDFFAGTKIALDRLELGSEEILHLLSELRILGAYEQIVIDMDFSLDRSILKILHASNAVVMVSDGSETSNTKTFRALSALGIMEQNSEDSLLDKMVLAYNKFSNKTSRTLEGLEIKVIGGAPRYQHATTEEVVSTLSSLELFDKIMS